MGTDIYIELEQRVNNLWKPLEIDAALMPDDRYYNVFNFLSDLKLVNEGIFTNRGIPFDTSVNINKLGDYGHTYAYVDEILAAPWKENGLEDCYFFAFFKHILPRLVPCDFFEDQRNIRAVWGFDN